MSSREDPTEKLIVLAEDGTSGGTRSKRCVFSAEGIAPCILASGWKDQVKVAL